jgi:biotin synthase
MKNIILELEELVYLERDLSFEEAMSLAQINNSDDIKFLCDAADRIRERFNGNSVDLCSIMNAKSGRCSEDCKFCAQSAHYRTKVEEYGIVSMENAIKLAKENESEGLNRFSLVTSGRGLVGKELEEVIKIYRELRKEVSIDLCASLGILNHEQLLALSDTGITMYHHNLETSREHYEKVCSTHSYDERIETIEAAKKVGLKVCCGGIIGMGETMEDRIKLAFEVKKLEIQSIPVNVLNPIEGTPYENIEPLSQEEILKTIAIFRFINPKAYIRLAGGRNLIDEFGKQCFSAGANATITGNYLTTSGNKIVDDIEMINSLGLKVRDNN